jgi:hypothetical protein
MPSKNRGMRIMPKPGSGLVKPVVEPLFSVCSLIPDARRPVRFLGTPDIGAAHELMRDLSGLCLKLFPEHLLVATRIFLGRDQSLYRAEDGVAHHTRPGSLLSFPIIQFFADLFLKIFNRKSPFNTVRRLPMGNMRVNTEVSRLHFAIPFPLTARQFHGIDCLH